MRHLGCLVAVGFGFASALSACGGYQGDRQCASGSTQPCGTSLGQCEPGQQTCQNGRWSTCSGTMPTQETCNGLDDDCDGDVDEGCDCDAGEIRACGEALGLCEPGVQRCENGKWGPCGDASADRKHIAPAQEVCDDEDNDCDGDVDEGCDCDAGETRACGETLGLCEPGVQRCTDGKWRSCEDVSADNKHVGPVQEVCDGEDNDCDGDVDEGCDCRPSATRLCDGGPGVCRSGRQTCEAGSWGACVPLQSAGPELCDHLDNDCNGVVDDGFHLDVPCNSTGRCPQSRVCNAGGLSSACVDDVRLFSDERCDGIDNDCDGLVDRVSEEGSLRSVCECEGRILPIGDADDASIKDNLNLCAVTQCGGDRPRGLLVDGRCYPVCLMANSDPDGDGWGFENGSSCLVESSPRGRAAPPCDGIPLGMAITYCLDCDVTNDLPYAMCDSVPRFDLTAFGQERQWLKVDYTYTASGPARSPVNLWFHGGEGGRKHLPLVRIGDAPGRYQALLRAEDACFTASAAFGSGCPGRPRGQECSHCGDNEVCGALSECGAYDLRQAWLQVAAEFCLRDSGQHRGTVTVHQVSAVEPNCRQ